MSSVAGNKASGGNLLAKSGFAKFKKNFLRDRQLYLLIIIGIAPFLLFHYGPMYGVQIAFRDYRIADGITGSQWVGWKWFNEFLTDPNFKRIFLNTLIISLYSLVSFPLPIIMALLFNAMRRERYKSVAQTISYMPHFISMTVFVGIMNLILSPTSGIYGNIFRLLGGNGYPADFRTLAGSFRHLYVWSGVWQGMGWQTILYTLALSSVSAELHEAACLDGASRFKRILHVDLPAIMPTIAIMLILRMGGLISVGFEKAYLMQSPLNLSTSELISTYVYKRGLSDFRRFSYGTAVSLFNTAINVTLMLITNYISKKVTEDEISVV
ncbi:MAG: sugar ABC transporter permease [Oscillospiraceae bacterium]|nr:sugar ABC transporter permease [Oscillospiraceae bacterium]